MKGLGVRFLLACLALSAPLVVMSAGSAAAHEHRDVAGKYTFTVGWGDEPTYSGFKNSVQLILADKANKPVTDLTDTLNVEVSFGTQNVTLPVKPSFKVGVYGTPGDYRAYVVPTRPGTFTFHFTGTIHGDRIDEKFTSSEKTFDNVDAANAIEFPAKDPSTGELAQRLDRSLPRISARANKLQDDLGAVRAIGIIGLILAVVGVTVGGVAISRRR